MARNEYQKMGVAHPRVMVRDLLKLGWTQTELARKCRVSQATVSRLLTREHNGLDYVVGKRLERLWKLSPKPDRGRVAKPH